MEVDSPVQAPAVAEPEAGPSSPSVTPLPPVLPEEGTDEMVTDVASDPKTEPNVNGVNGGEETGSDTKGGNDAEPEEEVLPEGASEVLYVNNLNEKVKLDVMKQSLKSLFKQYGLVLDITAHRSIRMRGQAFVTLDSKDAAAKAVKEVQKFPLYGKPMQLAFAKTESDALVKKRHPETFDQHKEERLVRKKISRRDNPLRRKFLVQKEAARKAAEAAALLGPVPGGMVGVNVGSGLPGTTTRRIVQMPDEYLPPNKILFIQNLPDDTSKESLEDLFKTYPNLVQVRTIPGRKNIAFVEYTDEVSSGVARDHLHNVKFGQGDNALKLKVTFAKLG